MNELQKRQWLKRVLLLKVIMTLAVWALPTLLGPPAFLALFGIKVSNDPVFLRLFGAVLVAFGVAYWYAYRDPVRNVAIVKAGVVDNGLVTLAIVVLGMTVGNLGWFIWVSAVLTALFCIAFLVLMPREPSRPES
jgi:hypothetical protein